jgi:uncharacterized protein with PhoU and TrkA domain
MVENVKELLEDMKNMSELMLDLAYSSVFFENKEIAKEVMILYTTLEGIEERLYLHLFAASRGRQVQRLISVIDLVENSKRVASAARNMAELVLEGVELHPIVKEALKESEESVMEIRVGADSPLKGKAIGDVRVRSATGATILAMKRNDKWIFNPGKNTDFLPNDLLICMGQQESCRKFQKMINGELLLEECYESKLKKPK